MSLALPEKYPLDPRGKNLTYGQRREELSTARFIDIRVVVTQVYKKPDGTPIVAYEETLQDDRDRVRKAMADFELANGLIASDGTENQPVAETPATASTPAVETPAVAPAPQETNMSVPPVATPIQAMQAASAPAPVGIPPQQEAPMATTAAAGGRKRKAPAGTQVAPPPAAPPATLSMATAPAPQFTQAPAAPAFAPPTPNAVATPAVEVTKFAPPAPPSVGFAPPPPATTTAPSFPVPVTGPQVFPTSPTTATTVDLSPVLNAINAIAEKVDGINARVGALAERVATIEQTIKTGLNANAELTDNVSQSVEAALVALHHIYQQFPALGQHLANIKVADYAGFTAYLDQLAGNPQ